MTFPTPFEVGWHTWSAGTATGRNTPTDVYTPALTATGTSVKVIGWAPTRETEPNATRVESDIDLFVPPGVASQPKDVVDLPIGRFEVVGWPQDFTYGPFGFQPGAVIKLKRIQQ
jgi:hypothetical protein